MKPLDRVLRELRPRLLGLKVASEWPKLQRDPIKPVEACDSTLCAPGCGMQTDASGTHMRSGPLGRSLPAHSVEWNPPSAADGSRCTAPLPSIAFGVPSATSANSSTHSCSAWCRCVGRAARAPSTESPRAMVRQKLTVTSHSSNERARPLTTARLLARSPISHNALTAHGPHATSTSKSTRRRTGAVGQWNSLCEVDGMALPAHRRECLCSCGLQTMCQQRQQ